jgi:hypothetical protein
VTESQEIGLFPTPAQEPTTDAPGAELGDIIGSPQPTTETQTREPTGIFAPTREDTETTTQTSTETTADTDTRLFGQQEQTNTDSDDRERDRLLGRDSDRGGRRREADDPLLGADDDSETTVGQLVGSSSQRDSGLLSGEEALDELFGESN